MTMPRRIVSDPHTSAPLLCFSEVSKSRREGDRQIVVLERVSFQIDAGLCVGVYGTRRSGKSTLLRLACAIEPPDGGTIQLDGRDITGISPQERTRLHRGLLAFIASDASFAMPGATVLDNVAMSAGSKGSSLREARRRALGVLDRVELAALCAEEAVSSLSTAERARVTLACALVREPRLLVIDEPAPMPRVGERERFCALVRALARERDIALLMASEDIAALQGMAVLMSISAGEICSTDQPSPVVELAKRRTATTTRL